jgi:hypothetical protein
MEKSGLALETRERCQGVSQGVRYPFLLPKEEIENIRYAIKRSGPHGLETWVSKTVARFGLGNTLRNLWRPEKGT